jgi:hypothetical protein
VFGRLDFGSQGRVKAAPNCLGEGSLSGVDVAGLDATNSTIRADAKHESALRTVSIHHCAQGLERLASQTQGLLELNGLAFAS